MGSSTATTSSLVLLFLPATPSACTSTPSGKLLPSMSGCTTAAPSSWLFSTSSSASTPTWVVSGNSPTAWACALGSASLTALLSLQPPLSSWFTPSVRVPSLTQCPWASLAPSTTCWCSRPTQHPDAPLPHAGRRRCFRRQLVLRHARLPGDLLP